MQGLLLVEFAVINRFHRANTFPFYHGRLKALGLRSRWLRFAVPPANELLSGGSGVALNPEELQVLSRALEEHGPSHLVFSHQPSEEVIRTLAPLLAGVAMGYEGFSTHGDAAREDVLAGLRLQRITAQERSFESFLGLELEDPSQGMIKAGTPDFGWEPGNPAARTLDALPFVICGEECTYNRSFKLNPFYQGLDFDCFFRKGGCAFCTRPENQGRWSEDPMDLLDRQLRAIAETCPKTSPRHRIRMVGEPVMERIDQVAGLILASGLEGADFLLDSRADTLVRVLDKILAALKLLDGSGHKLHLSLIGVESFTSGELGRLNKGLDPADNIRAIRIILELEHAWPRGFGFRDYGGLSLVSFTPWTRAWEIDLNIAVAELLGVEDHMGKLYDGRLRLYPGLPLEAIARRDDLVVESYDDPLLDTARRTFYENELPWRFEDPAMETINRLLLRLDNDAPVLEGDDLTREVRDLIRELVGSGETTLPQLAHSIIQAALELGPEAGPDQVLAQVRQTARKGAQDQTPETEEWNTHAGLHGEDGRLTSHLRTMMELKPVLKFEPVKESDLDNWLKDPELPNPRPRKRAQVPGERQDIREVFLGRDPALVERAIALTDQMEAAEEENQAWADAATEVGVLLGYPRCCSRAFAQERHQIRQDYFWTLVDRRLAIPGEVPWELCPALGTLIEYVPCALDCKESLERSRDLYQRRRDQDRERADALGASLRNPHLIFVGLQAASMELIPTSAPGTRFHYRVGETSARGRDAELVIAGDELVIEPECLFVLKDGRAIGSLSGRAFVWWYRQVFQQEFWTAILDFRKSIGDRIVSSTGSKDQDTGGSGSPGLSPGLTTLVERIRTMMKETATGYSVTGVESLHGRVRITLAAGDQQVVLTGEELTEGARFFLKAGTYALSHPKDHPLDTPAKLSAAKAFAARLAAILN